MKVSSGLVERLARAYPVPNMSRAEDLELAIDELVALVNEEALREQRFQDWFERHDWIFSILGYERVLAHPVLETGEEDGETYCPDFMGQLNSGIWEIIELKRPDTDVLKPATRRQDFYSDFSKYLSQCDEYLRYFEDSQNRKRFGDRYSTTVQTRVKSTLIAGRSAGLDRGKIHDLIADRRMLEFQTYDEILSRLGSHWRQTWGENDGAPGLSLHMRCFFPRPASNERLWVADLGDAENENRVSVYLQNESMHVDVVDSIGRQFQMQIPIGDAVPGDFYLGFELGLETEFSFGRIWINKASRMTRWVPMPFRRPDFVAPIVVGSDMLGQGRTDMFFCVIAVTGTVSTLVERIRQRKHMIEAKINTWLHCVDGAFMHNVGHPKFPRSQRVTLGGHSFFVPFREAPSGNMVQYDNSRQPVVATDPRVLWRHGEPERP